MNRISNLISAYIEKKVSDLHFHEGEKPYYRKYGRIEISSEEAPVTAAEIRDFMQYIGLVEKKYEDLEKLGACDAGIYLEDINVNLRLNFYSHDRRLGLAVRCLNGTIPDFETLNLPPVMKEVLGQKSGLVLVTGLTGNGKSTTIASLVNIINNTEQKHIITIEDPIEYHYPQGRSLVTQREIPDDCRSFDEGLRSALRQDPDIIVIGEMRDRDTIRVTLEAAESGHLVFSTLHTSSAAASIDRIVSYFSEEEQNNVRAKLSSVLAAVFTQKIIPSADKTTVYPAVEVMFPALPIRALIRDGKIYQITNYIKMNSQSDMISMDDALAHMVRKGLITEEDALKNANDRQDLYNALNPVFKKKK